MTEPTGAEPKHPDIDLPPPPPTRQAARLGIAYLAITGVLHLVLAATADCLMELNLALGLIDLVVAVVVAVLLARAEKRQAAWWRGVEQRVAPTIR